ncbi:MAG: Gfo/Idh/MocA family oxidoreductase [Edaphobacter sp.]|uniref:Gfo/Idh/MocA family protein n=1 Tax=Edaphobacter sp. TaxID=1934404 RepID=UPI0023953513|nr:Gfo/Idh/MocA family oxidoreductase [Edaphobacter sp.]MDE1175661.1 Gfo/Idh/MocA family oxidoreductase [Edaphobacter sp.]
MSDLSRRGFLKMGAVGAMAVAAPGMTAEEHKPQGKTVIGMPFQKMNPRIGIIGTGGRGTSLLGNLLAAEANILAICDAVPEHAEHAKGLVEKAGQKSPVLYTKGENDFENLVARDDLDLIIIATPWNWHVPMAVAAMQHGKHVAVEVPAATTLEDCWKLVNTSEATRRHCMMLENCCYGYNETLVLRLTHAGLLGDLLYGEGAYLHDLREELFSGKGEGLWRRTVHTQRDGNLYPTHGLGPVANYMGIQRGDRFDYMVSMSSPQHGLELYRKEHIPASDPRWKERYLTGDMNVSMIKTANGRTITVKHDVSNPRPYDRINQVAGTKGIFMDYPPRIYIEGQKGGEDWTNLDGFKEFQHPLWKEEGTTAQRVGGHGGMDYIMLYRLLQCVRQGIAPDMDVYDAAAWSAPGPLSRLSVAHGSAPVQFPDFTRGGWKERSASAIAL